MALQFTPPPEDLVNAYLKRSPGQEASAGIQQALQMYVQQKAAEAQQANKNDEAYIGAYQAGGPDLAAQIAARRGIKTPPTLASQPPVPSTGTAGGYDVNASTPTELNAQQSIPTEHPELSPIVQASLNAGHPAIHPDVKGYQLPTPEQMATWQNQGKYGASKMAESKTALDMNKTIEGMQPQTEPVMTHQKALEAGTVPKGTRIIEEPTINVGTKESQQQDKLEEQYRKSFQQLRGDPSLKRTEEQRDAAAIAYNRIKEVKDHGQILNPIDYVDVLGQIYKARTGSAPTETVLSEARQQTAKGKYEKAYTFLTGQQAPATTQDIMDSLQTMARSMGEQADKFHDGYMRSRIKPPLGLAHDRVQNVVAERGMSFAEATGLDKENPGTHGTLPTITDDASFNALPSGSQFKDPSGQVHRKK